MTLHQIIDQKVDVYADNEEFTNMLNEYNSTGSEKLLDKMWIIAFRCSANIIKKNKGSVWNTEDIIDYSIRLCEVLFSRIKNGCRGNGEKYIIYNLPTVINNIFLNEYYNKDIKKVNEEAKVMYYDPQVLSNYIDSIKYYEIE